LVLCEYLRDQTDRVLGGPLQNKLKQGLELVAAELLDPINQIIDRLLVLGEEWK
jgi:hypothetical protein